MENLQSNDAITMRTQWSILRPVTVLLLLAGMLAVHAQTDRVKVIQVPGASKIFKAQSGKDGTIHLVFDSDDGPQYLQSRDSGATFSKPLAVVDAASRRPGLKFNAWDLAVGP